MERKSSQEKENLDQSKNRTKQVQTKCKHHISGVANSNRSQVTGKILNRLASI